MPGFKSFLVEPSGDRSLPIIITTAFRDRGNYLTSEYFLLLPGARPAFYAMRYQVHPNNVPPDVVPIDEAFMFDEALRGATLALHQHLHQESISSGHQGMYTRPGIVEDNRNLLVAYRMRGASPEFLDHVRAQTGCGPLNEFLGLVQNFPAFDIRRLS